MRVCLSAIAALAAWSSAAGAETPPFRVGFIAEAPGDPALTGLAHIRAGFERALGRPVQILVARDYPAMIEAHVSGRLDYAVYSGMAFAAASARCACLRPLAAPVSGAGAIGIRSVLIVKEDAGRATDPEAELAGRVAVGPADSVAGRLAPLAHLPAVAGGEVTLVEADSMSEAERLFAQGDVDAFFGWIPAGRGEGDVDEGVGTLARIDGMERVATGRIAWHSDLLVNGPHAVRTDLDDETVSRLATFLRTMRSVDPALYALMEKRLEGGFVGVTLDDYAPYARMVETVSGRD